MISYLKGNLEVKNIDYVVIEVGGIGYKVYMSSNSINRLGEIGNNVKIYTYMRVREDDISLYGFCTNEELRMFEQLLGVSGIGAKSALTILANISPSSFALAIISGDINTLKKLPGIGAKSAQRMILELKDKMKTQDAIENGEEIININNSYVENDRTKDAIEALQVLGYSRRDIELALSKLDVKNDTVEEIIRKGLKYLGM
jgi:Holliday junction DNA helicase RuvA